MTIVWCQAASSCYPRFATILLQEALTHHGNARHRGSEESLMACAVNEYRAGLERQVHTSVICRSWLGSRWTRQSGEPLLQTTMRRQRSDDMRARALTHDAALLSLVAASDKSSSSWRPRWRAAARASAKNRSRGRAVGTAPRSRSVRRAHAAYHRRSLNPTPGDHRVHLSDGAHAWPVRPSDLVGRRQTARGTLATRRRDSVASLYLRHSCSIWPETP